MAEIIPFNPQGIQITEVAGISACKERLPADWFGFANLLLRMPSMSEQAPEIDLFLFTYDHVFLIDFKHWRGIVTNKKGKWHLGNKQKSRSPVNKIVENAKKFPEILRGGVPQLLGATPRAEACVVFTHEDVDFSGLSAEEIPHVWHLNKFIALLRDERKFYERFSRSAYWGKDHSLCESKTRKAIEAFFHGPRFEVREAVFEGYKPEQTPTFVKKSDSNRPIYSEYQCELVEDPSTHALFRYWDFAQLPTELLTYDVRKSIADRERAALRHLQDVNLAFYDDYVLKPKVWDRDYGINYWEIIDARNGVRRIMDAINRERGATQERRIEIAAAILARADELHCAGMAHRDLGVHSVWLDEHRQRVMLSMFTASHFPERESIGALRYQITASLRAPSNGDMQTPTRIDVFLLGALVWQLFTGKPLSVEPDGAVPFENIDSELLILGVLKDWFKMALARDERQRFRDATQMLSEFCKATRRPESAIDFDAALAPFESRQPALLVFPMVSSPEQRRRVLVWESVVSEHRVFVKQWARPQTLDGKAILLQFLERAKNFVSIEAYWLPRLVAFGWHSGDCFVAQEKVQGYTWDRAVEAISSIGEAYELVQSLTNAVSQLHSIGSAHGDLKADNIIVSANGGQGPSVQLLDLFDLPLPSDGQILTIEDAGEPVYFDPFLRDRATVGRLSRNVLQLFGAIAGSEPGPSLTLTAIEECEQSDFAWQSLDPILSSFEQAHAFASLPEAHLAIGVARTGKGERLLSSDGIFNVVVDSEQSSVIIYGLDEGVQLFIGYGARPTHAAVITARDAANFAHARAIMRFRGSVDAHQSERFEPGDVAWIVQQDVVAAAIRGFATEQAVDEQPLQETAHARTEQIEDIHSLWRESIAVEDEAIPRIRLVGDVLRDPAREAHIMRFDGDLSSLLDDDNGKIQLRCNNRYIGWTRPRDIAGGQLIAYDCRAAGRLGTGDEITAQPASSRENLTRRSRAVERILDGKAVVPDLLEYMEPWCDKEPTTDHVEDARRVATEQYGLRDEQIDAFDLCLSTGPVAYVHGPPGTGKTKFIASLVHYGIASGRYERVIVSSQSNEAVNNVADRLMSLFGDDSIYRLLRVGPQSNVSDAVMALHSEAIQGRYRERFISEELLRFSSAAAELGLPETFAEGLVDYFKRVRRIAAESLGDENVADTALDRHSLAALEEIGIDPPDDASGTSFLELLMERYGVTNLDAAKRLERLIRLGDQWRSALAGGRRTLEDLFSNTREVIIGTCVGLGRDTLRVDGTSFDLAVIDEAARCSPGELAIAMQSAKKIILVGDHKQLPPYLEKDNLRALADRLNVHDVKLLEQSDFERGITSRFGARASKRLGSQWRMAPAIGRLVSQCFYDGQLQTIKVKTFEPYGDLTEPLGDQVTWLDTGPLEWRSGELRVGKYDVQNEAEVDCIIAVLKRLAQNDRFWHKYDMRPPAVEAPIGIICMYRKQLELLEQRAYTSGLTAEFLSRVKMGTVDSYQGKENPIVILSLVRNNRYNDIGYLRYPQRINVSISRAMERLLIVGSFPFFASIDNPLERVARHITENSDGCRIISAATVVEGAL